jgi:hypothetical protein
MESPRLATFVAIAVLAGMPGCSLFQEQVSPRLTSEVLPGEAAGVAPQVDKFTVELRADSGKTAVVEQPISGELTVQQALEQSKALKRFKRMDIELYRPLPSGGWHKMTLEFDRGSRTVPPEYDYAVLPGDRIVLIEDTSTFLDDILKQTTEPLGLTFPGTSRESEVAAKYRVAD